LACTKTMREAVTKMKMEVIADCQPSRLMARIDVSLTTRHDLLMKTQHMLHISFIYHFQK